MGGLTRAERNIAWIERYLRVPEGRFVGRPLVVAPYMREDFRLIYDNPHGTRRAIISRGRKNAKTAESAMILLLHLCGPEALPNSQLYSTAQSRDQAAIVFNLAAKMVRMSPDLSSVVAIRDTAKQILCPELGSVYRALSAEAHTALGLSPALTIHDELGQVEGPRSPLYEALETAAAAQADPLSIIISTQAATDGDLLSLLIDDAMQGHDPRTVLRLDTAPDTLDPFSVEAIRTANPAFDVFMNKDEVLAMAADAKRLPSREAAYRNLVLNQRIAAESLAFSPEVWRANGGAPDLGLFEDMPVYGGLDLSSSKDLTALVLVTRDKDDVVHVWPHFFAPEQGLADRSRADRVPYDVWARQGLLTLTPGATVDYAWVAHRLAEIATRCDLRTVAFDRWRVDILRRDLDRLGASIPLEPHGQGFKDMDIAVRALESEVLNARLRHGMHPVLTMCAQSAALQVDPAGLRKFVKGGRGADRRRIDGMVALAMAVRAMAGDSGAPAQPSYLLTDDLAVL